MHIFFIDLFYPIILNNFFSQLMCCSEEEKENISDTYQHLIPKEVLKILTR